MLNGVKLWLRCLAGAAIATAGLSSAVALTVVSASPASAATAATKCTHTWAKGVSGDWTTAADWTPKGIPSSGNVCITAKGTYTVTLTQSESLSSLTVGGTSGTATLAVDGSNASSSELAATTGSTTADGVILLESTKLQGGSYLQGTTFTNEGAIDTNPTGGGERFIETDIENKGGSLNLDASKTAWDEGNEFINLSGSVNVGTGDTVVFDGSTFDEVGGTTTGSPILNGGTLNYTGTGASSFTLNGEVTVSGNLASDQSLIVQGGGDAENADLLMTRNLTNAGTITLTSINASYTSDISGNGFQLDNTGTLDTLQGSGATAYIEANTLNQGTMNLNAAETYYDEGNTLTNSSGTIAVGTGDQLVETGQFNQGGGVVSGPAPTLTNELDITGSGAGSFDLVGETTLAGNSVAGQTVTVLGNEADGDGYTSLANNFTNGGTLVFDSQNSGDNTDIEGSFDLTNTGTLETVQDQGGTRYLEVNIDNEGTLEVGAQDTTFDEGNTLTNASGTVAIATAADLSTNGTFDQGNGTVTGPAPVIEGSELDLTGSGAGSFDLEDNGTLAGNSVAGQTVTVLATAASGDDYISLANNFTNGGTLVFDSQASTDNTDVASTNSITNTGTIESVQDGGGVRYFEADITNSGTIDFDAASNLFDEGQTLTNESGGTVSVADGSVLDMSGGGALALDSGGTLALSFASSGSTTAPVQSSGTVTLGGALTVSTSGTPANGTVFDLVKASSVSGTFSSATSGYTITYKKTSASATFS